MALDYLTATATVTPQFQVSAIQKINAGYQKLLSYEVLLSGGFSWYGDAPANTMLTTFGLRLFTDMSGVMYIDELLIPRIQQFLVSRQFADGSWEADRTNYLPRYDNRLYSTAYVAGALAYSGYSGPALDQAVEYIRQNLAAAPGIYDKALCAETLILIDPADSDGLAILDDLAALVQEEGQGRFWNTSGSDEYGVMGSYGDSFKYELTGRIATTMMRAGMYSSLVQGTLYFLIAHKDVYGNWYTTQSTIYGLKTLIMAQEQTGTANTDGTAAINVNGTVLAPVTITPADAEVMKIVSCKDYLQTGSNNVTVSFTGTGNPMAQVVWEYYVARTAPIPGDIEVIVNYSKTNFTVAEYTTATVTISNTRTDGRGANTVVAEIGIPPGFVVSLDDLESARTDGVIDRYEIDGQQINIYRNLLDADSNMAFSYDLTPSCPLKVQTPETVAYEYYAPEVGPGVSPPILITVTN
jgi:hypothetical protein